MLDKIAVIFDMDGLLLDTERLGKLAWVEAAGEFGFDLQDDTFLKIVGCNLKQAEQILVSHFGPSFDFMAVRTRRLEIGARIESQERAIKKKPGADELLEFLSVSGIKKAVGTSTDRARATQRLKCVGLIDKFEVIITSDDIKNGKPAPDTFLEAAKRLGSQPKKTIVLEDSPVGIIAAVRAQMIPILVPDMVLPSKETREMCFGVYDSLLDVIPVLGGCTSKY